MNQQYALYLISKEMEKLKVKGSYLPDVFDNIKKIIQDCENEVLK